MAKAINQTRDCQAQPRPGSYPRCQKYMQGKSKDYQEYRRRVGGPLPGPRCGGICKGGIEVQLLSRPRENDPWGSIRIGRECIHMGGSKAANSRGLLVGHD